VALIIREVGELAYSFNSFAIQHTLRSMNVKVSTHLCAKLACTLMMMGSCLGSVPDFLATDLQVSEVVLVCVE
jgi:hypothetical protein